MTSIGQSKTLPCLLLAATICLSLALPGGQVVNNRPMARVSLRLPGIHNVLNSLAVGWTTDWSAG